MFQVKATVIGFMGNEERYPCHFQHKVGDEFIYDGEKYIGRICPSISSMLVPRMIAYHAAGPRLIPPPGSYYPFWYAPLSVKDPNMKKYDGLGFRNVLKTIVEPKYHIRNWQPLDAFKWPPHHERTVSTDTSKVICPDTRTSMVMKIEAFDLSEKGYDVPYFRRQMSILSKVLAKPDIKADKILNEFSREQIEAIYPALSPVMMEILVEELALMGYLDVQKGKASVTRKGEAKLKDFKKKLSVDERKVLKI